VVGRNPAVPLANMPRAALRDDGTTLPLVVMSLVVLFGMAAFAIDVGLLYNGRRQAQTAADSAALSGALAMGDGEPAAVAAAMDQARHNLDETYDDATWSNQWAVCSDPDRPPSFTPSAASDCISIDNTARRFRVRIPPQRLTAIFGSVLGVDAFDTDAFAVAGFAPSLVRPFGLPANPATGEYCLQNPPGGHAKLPCTGPTSGNFGSMHNPRHTLGCPGNKNDALVWNIARGIDHGVAVWTAGDPLVVDQCPNVNPNQIETDTGNFPNEMTTGMATGGVPLAAGEPALLQQGTNPKIEVVIGGFSHFLDDGPLWDYLIPNATLGCDPAGFTGLDGPAATIQMEICLDNWAGGELFESKILQSPRFMIIPEFLEADLPSGTEARTIAKFRAVFVNALGFGDVTFYPGGIDPVVFADTADIIQTTSFILPNTPLVATYVTPGADGVLRSQRVELVE